MTDQPLSIYHLVPAGYFQAQSLDQPYKPQTFDEEGFIHCTSGTDKLIEIANTYFDALPEDLLVLEIDPQRLTVPLKYEPPIHPTGQDPMLPKHRPLSQEQTPPDSEILFPHIYGLLNREAIIDNFSLQRDETGRWQMASAKRQVPTKKTLQR